MDSQKLFYRVKDAANKIKYTLAPSILDKHDVVVYVLTQGLDKGVPCSWKWVSNDEDFYDKDIILDDTEDRVYLKMIIEEKGKPHMTSLFSIKHITAIDKILKTYFHFEYDSNDSGINHDGQLVVVLKVKTS